MYLKWDSFVPKAFKRGLVHCLLHRAWNICSDYHKFDHEVKYLKTLLQSNGYPLNFVEACVAKYLNKCYSPPREPMFGPEKKTLTVSLPFCGNSSYQLKRQLTRIYCAVFPWLNLRIVFRPMEKLGKLSKLKSQFDRKDQSNVVYKVNCKDCPAYYIGMATRRLHQRLHEHSTSDCSALYCHSSETGHEIDYSNPSILDMDNIKSRLLIKETLHIQSSKSMLNRNVGSFELKLW